MDRTFELKNVSSNLLTQDVPFCPECSSSRVNKNSPRVLSDGSKNQRFLCRITNNPRLLKIHFHTLRHWKASNEYERTGDIYAVKHLLGHKSISNTDPYQHGTFSNDDYVTKRPQTSLEEDTLISAGFEFVRFDQKENVPIYRKRK